jgi:hypothetical protein
MPHQSKFFPLLRTLSPDELLRFQKFLQKYHGGEAATLKVFAYCKRFHDPQIDADKIDLAGIYRKLFKAEMGNQLSDRKKMLNPLSDLHLRLKEFLLSEKIRDESFESKMILLEIYQKRRLHKDFSHLASDIYQVQGEQKLPDADACLQRISAGLRYKRHLVQNNAKPNFDSLTNCIESIKQAADILSLKMACEILNNQSITSKKQASNQPAPAQPLMSLYQMIFSMLSSGNEDDFAPIVAFLDEHLHLFGEAEVMTIIRLLHNFAAPRIRSAKVLNWKKQVYALDKILLKKGLYTLHGVISATSFCNIVNIATAAQEMEWAKDFIRNYGLLLPDEVREECIKLTQAIIAFEEKKYAKVIELVKDPQIKHIQHVIRAKALKLRALYELNPQDDAMDDLYLSFKIYLKRNRKEQPDFVDATLSFLELFNKLYRRKVTKQALMHEIENTPNLYFYHWLLEKAASYKRWDAT